MQGGLYAVFLVFAFLNGCLRWGGDWLFSGIFLPLLPVPQNIEIKMQNNFIMGAMLSPIVTSVCVCVYIYK